MLIHDSFSSVGVTLALLSSTFFGSSFRYVGRSGSMTEYRRSRRSTHVSGFVTRLARRPRCRGSPRNVVVKLCIMAKLRPLYRLLGSDGNWPY